MADPPTSWANQSIRASIVGLSTKSEDIARPTVARTYLLGELESTRRRSKAQGGPGCRRKVTNGGPQAWRDMMKTLIAALALVTLIASPTFARPAARASTQAEFVFPTDQQLCRSGQTDFCHWGDTLFGSGIAAPERPDVLRTGQTWRNASRTVSRSSPSNSIKVFLSMDARLKLAYRGERPLS
jgi:hypothetical protein